VDPNKELESIAQPLSLRVARAGLRSLSEPERTAYLVWSFAHELDNGGPDAFFYNASGRFAEQTVDALQAIAARTLASALEEVIEGFPDGEVPEDQEERTEALDEVARDLEDALDRLREAYEERGSERVHKATLRYFHAQTGGAPAE
jgi:hypothetical protein